MGLGIKAIKKQEKLLGVPAAYPAPSPAPVAVPVPVSTDQYTPASSSTTAGPPTTRPPWPTTNRPPVLAPATGPSASPGAWMPGAQIAGKSKADTSGRQWLADRGIQIGKRAWETHDPNATRWKWKDAAARMGVDTSPGWQKRDPELFADVQNAVYGYGHTSERAQQFMDSLNQSLANDPSIPGGGAGGAGGAQQSLEGATEALIRGLMSGKEGPYNEQAISRLTGSATARRAGDLKNANEEAYLAAVRGGTAQSPGAAATLAANAREARGGLAGDVGNIRSQATTENFKAKLQGLEQAQTTISRTFQDRWNKATDATQRLQIEKEYDAAMQKIAADKEMAQAQINAAGASASSGHAWDLENRDAQWAREDMIYQRDLPLLLTQMSLGSYGE